jgi:hypothetical protein
MIFGLFTGPFQLCDRGWRIERILDLSLVVAFVTVRTIRLTKDPFRNGTLQKRSTWTYYGQTYYGQPAVVHGRQLVIEGAEVPPHPARDGW